MNLQIIIKDTGVGISQKKQKDIFETFSQGSLQINNKYGGTGLGLSIVKNLLELMNSKIYLESVLGQGSKFWFDISFNIPVDENENLIPDKKEFDLDMNFILDNSKKELNFLVWILANNVFFTTSITKPPSASSPNILGLS